MGCLIPERERGTERWRVRDGEKEMERERGREGEILFWCINSINIYKLQYNAKLTVYIKIVAL